MAQELVITVLGVSEYLANPLEIGLDEDWVNKSRNFDSRMKSKGVYVLHVENPLKIIYIGKTSGPTMDFHTRLYRHATKSASQSSPRVYRMLKEIKKETGSPILVSLITKEQIRGLFKGKSLGDTAMIDIYEQVAIHLLRPKMQQE